MLLYKKLLLMTFGTTLVHSVLLILLHQVLTSTTQRTLMVLINVFSQPGKTKVQLFLYNTQRDTKGGGTAPCILDPDIT